MMPEEGEKSTATTLLSAQGVRRNTGAKSLISATTHNAGRRERSVGAKMALVVTARGSKTHGKMTDLPREKKGE